MDKAFLPGLMEEIILGLGSMANSMEKDFIAMGKDLPKKENGKKGKE